MITHYLNLNVAIINEISILTRSRFKRPQDFKHPEALIMHEQNYVTDDQLLKACMLDYDLRLETPKLCNVQAEVITNYADSNFIPIKIDDFKKEMHLMTIPEFAGDTPKPFMNYKVVKHFTTIYHFVNSYKRYYGIPSFLSDVPIKDLFTMVVNEAIDLRAADITLTTSDQDITIYYNVRKRKVESKRYIDKLYRDELIRHISSLANSSFMDTDDRPKYMGMDLDTKHRGRVCINKTLNGYMISIRVLENGIFKKSLETLSLAPKTVAFIRKYCMNLEPGLVLLVGPTFSGKNTTIASMLYEMNKDNKYKVISVEMPVELEMQHVEQIQASTEESYAENAASLIRSNPDVAYLSEMTEYSSLPTMKVANTSKPVFSTIHANSIVGVISRLNDITGLSYERIMELLKAVIFQNLKRDEEKDIIYPVNNVMYFSQEFKDSLYGLSYGEMMVKIREEATRWDSIEI